MMHFDFQVGDLDSAVAEALALGASLAQAGHRRTFECSFDTCGPSILPLSRTGLRRHAQMPFAASSDAIQSLLDVAHEAASLSVLRNRRSPASR